MKAIRILLIVLAVIIPQLFVRNYMLIVSIWICIGFVAGIYFSQMKVLRYIAIAEFLTAIIILLAQSENLIFLYDITSASGLPTYSVNILFVLFNVINVSLCFTCGFVLNRLFLNSTER